jgi:Ca-activated chloride channel family protein
MTAEKHSRFLWKRPALAAVVAYVAITLSQGICGAVAQEPKTETAGASDNGSAQLSAPAEVPVAGIFEVQWHGPNEKSDYIVMVPAGSEPGTWPMSYAYAQKGSPGRLTAPKEPGSYELRYMAGGMRSEQVLASRPLSVVVPQIVLSAPARVAPGAKFEVHWQGPDAINDYIALSTKDALSGTAVKRARTGTGNPVFLTAPSDPTRYPEGLVLRYMMGSNWTAHEQPIVVGEIPGPANVADIGSFVFTGTAGFADQPRIADIGSFVFTGTVGFEDRSRVADIGRFVFTGNGSR